MMRRRTTTCLVAVVLVAALALPAAASGRGPFSDCESHWAKEQIAMLKGAGVLKGVGNGLFNPEGNMTRAEVAVMLLRALGLEGETEGEGGGDALPFADNALLPAWSRNHVRVCFQYRLMLGEMQAGGRFFNPNKPITRQEFVALLTRAMDEEDGRDLEALAQQLMGDAGQLTFRDRKAIGAWAVGYILLAIQEGWVQGYGDNTFQPNKPVTRAEAAAFMERLEACLGCRWSGRYVGTVVSVDTAADSITILTEGEDEEPGEELTFTLGEGCLVYAGKTPSELGALEEGWEVKVFVQDDLAVFIKACEPEDEDDEDEEQIAGAITAIHSETAMFTVAVSDSDSKTVKVTNRTEITVDGVEDKALADLTVGMTVTVTGHMAGATLVAGEVEAASPAP